MRPHVDTHAYVSYVSKHGPRQHVIRGVTERNPIPATLRDAIGALSAREKYMRNLRTTIAIPTPTTEPTV